MLSNRLIRWAVVIVCVLSVYGCSKKSNPPAPKPTPSPTATTAAAPEKTEAQYKADADKKINEQNASQELSKLEKEVAADANQP